MSSQSDRKTLFKGALGALLMSGVSLTALSTGARAQDAAPAAAPDADSTVVVVTGIRGSLRNSMQTKKNGQGVVDSISSEDMGKFPDTNLAESLQRITGVSIDRSNGEGSFVTVRGFGPEFNLVTLNGRQMPTSTLGDGGSAPSSRSFDFANLASEGVAGVDVYKSGRASVDSGGIGSTINIRTPRPLDRPGLRGSVGVKAVYDTSENDGSDFTPEVSGIISDTFADNKFGILLTGSYQKRKASNNDFSAGWRDGYLGNENNWGSLAPAGNPNITNHPDATDVYEVQQNGAYDIHDIERERLNGQLVLQFRPTETLTATLDYTYSKNKVTDRTSSTGVWFNFGDVASAWTDGPVAGPIWYSEHFDAPSSTNQGKDLAYSASLTANQSENKSTGLNLKWAPLDHLTFELDAHHSTAESRPDSPYGSNMSIGASIFGVVDQKIDYSSYLPTMSYSMAPGIDYLDKSIVVPTGNAFRNAYFKDTIDQIQAKGRYRFDDGIIDSIDFGVAEVKNKVRSAFGVIQHDTWSGVGPASDIPDDIFELVSIPDKFDGLDGANNPAIPQQFLAARIEDYVAVLDQKYQVCGGTMDCLSDYTTDRHIEEKTDSAYVQVNSKFSLFDQPAHLVAGLRYEKTDIDSSAVVPTPVSSAWNAANEFNVNFSGSETTAFQGSYQHWLPAIDFDARPIDNLVVRASASTTITRPDYASMQGGLTLDSLFRAAANGGTGSRGNPGLEPYKSNNIDLSAEWYYGRESYVSLGYFHKDVSNFISTSRFDYTNNILTPYGGARYNAAVAAVGATGDIRGYIFNQYVNAAKAVIGAGATYDQVRDYVNANFADEVHLDNAMAGGTTITGQIIPVAGDPNLIFQITTPVNSDQTAALYGWEFNIQHSFADTGFGVILNYTKVDGDATYDPTQPATVTQFALTGLSDSANAVAFYDKNGIQARIAYNWRAKFLSGTGPNPTYVDDYGQFDASASWEFKPGLTAFIEGINLTNESRRVFGRSYNNVKFVAPGYARYSVGVRYTF